MRTRQWGVAIVCVLIGVGAVAVVRGQATDEFLATAREPDLVRLLDDLQSRQTRLDGEILRLQAAEQRLRTGTSAEALQAQESFTSASTPTVRQRSSGCITNQKPG